MGRHTSGYDNDDESGEYRTVTPHRPKKDVVGDWLTWAVRAVIPFIGYMVWQQLIAMQAMEVTIAKVSMAQDFETQQLNDHSRQLQRIWRELPNTPAGQRP